ncbi:DUF3304 domain-containing protein [Variovorax boronicumulans]|uniref:DUF3304 domain-containing protein n=1 Tax=Variovorax boronicumulans TaxID=436515 RepID=UPI0033990B4D
MIAKSINKDQVRGSMLGRWLQLAMALALLAVTSACKPAEPAESASYAAGITGYNFTSEGVQEFYVNGQWGSNLPPYGGGGGTTCCVNLPKQWRPGLVAKIDWTMGRWTTPYERRKHLSPAAQVACCSAERTLSKTVPIERYGTEGGRLQVFFLPNDEIKVWIYDAGPQHPDHPSGMGYPKNPQAQESR